mgnify:FL=1
MKAYELLSILCRGYVPIEQCGTYHFDSSDLSELTKLFGTHFSWSGHMFSGDLLYMCHPKNADWLCEDFDLIGQNLTDDNEEIYVFKIGD